jgi:hypothetical protein
MNFIPAVAVGPGLARLGARELRHLAGEPVPAGRSPWPSGPRRS